MKSLRARLTVWFAVGLVLVLAVFVAFTYRLLDAELRQKTWRSDYPEHPDWRLHGSYSEAEVKDILGEFVETSVIYGLPLALLAFLIGYGLARKSVQPISRVNQQLGDIRAQNLSQRINSPELDSEFRDLVRHINDLLARLERSFNDMREYSAKVAHELRTPLAILRLKLEQAGDLIAPELAEELQAELHQLTHVVDQSLLMAKAEQGRLILKLEEFDLALLVAEIAEDFSLLAQEEGRVVNLMPLVPVHVTADLKYSRQIVHNLFANALKHGRSEIRVQLVRSRKTHRLIISNRLRDERSETSETLGLGLRVVDTILKLQPAITFKRRRWVNAYSVRLSFPAAPVDSLATAQQTMAGQSIDVGI